MDFVFIILATMGVTVIFDVLRHPGGSTQFIWRHWWHTPLLALILFPISVVVTPLFNVISPLHGVASVVGIAAIIFFLWAFLTSGDPFELPSDSAQKKRMLRIANKLLGAGGISSLCILSINSLFWFPVIAWVVILLLSLILYALGFLLKYNTSRTREPKESKVPPPDPSHREPRRTEPDYRL